MTGALGRDHNDVDVLGGLDAAKVDIEAVGKRKGLALGEVGLDGLLIERRLLFIIDKDHNDVGNLCCFCGCHNRKTLCFRPRPAL